MCRKQRQKDQKAVTVLFVPTLNALTEKQQHWQLVDVMWIMSRHFMKRESYQCMSVSVTIHATKLCILIPDQNKQEFKITVKCSHSMKLIFPRAGQKSALHWARRRKVLQHQSGYMLCWCRRPSLKEKKEANGIVGFNVTLDTL